MDNYIFQVGQNFIFKSGIRIAMVGMNLTAMDFVISLHLQEYMKLRAQRGGQRALFVKPYHKCSSVEVLNLEIQT